jgi:CheY-like chemotaxis protein
MKNDRILIVSDDKAARWLLERQLQKLRVRTETVFSGADAVAKSRFNNYLLIFMNTKLAVMGGIEATREIRRVEALMKNRRVPIIAVTTPDDQEETLTNAGFDGQYPTPLSISDLQEILSRWLPINEGERPTAEV